MQDKQINIVGALLLLAFLATSTAVAAGVNQTPTASLTEQDVDADSAALSQPNVDAGEAIEEADPEAETEDPAHAELRQLRDSLLEAYTNQEVDRILPLLTDDVVLTMQNGDRCFGKAAFRDFFRQTFQEGAAAVETMSSDIRVDDLAILYDEGTAVAHGTSVDFFGLKNGTEFSLFGRWTATCIRTPDGWKLAAFHVSANVFDNAVLDTAKDWIAQVGLVGGMLGFFLGGSLMWVATRGR